MKKQDTVPLDLSERAIKFIRSIQPLPDGTYIIRLVKSENNAKWKTTVVKQETVVDNRTFMD